MCTDDNRKLTHSPNNPLELSDLGESSLLTEFLSGIPQANL